VFVQHTHLHDFGKELGVAVAKGLEDVLLFINLI
jgi:26S proteasome regulatory subunit N1